MSDMVSLGIRGEILWLKVFLAWGSREEVSVIQDQAGSADDFGGEAHEQH